MTWIGALVSALLAVFKALFGLDKPREEKVNEAKDPNAPDSSVFARPERLRGDTWTRGDSGNDLGKDGDTGPDRGRPEI